MALATFTAASALATFTAASFPPASVVASWKAARRHLTLGSSMPSVSGAFTGRPTLHYRLRMSEDNVSVRGGKQAARCSLSNALLGSAHDFQDYQLWNQPLLSVAQHGRPRQSAAAANCATLSRNNLIARGLLCSAAPKI